MQVYCILKMKTLIFTSAALLCLVFSACSNQGAYSQKEKDSLDKVDTSGREDKFKALENPVDSSATSEKSNSEKNNTQEPKASVPKTNGGPEPLQKTK